MQTKYETEKKEKQIEIQSLKLGRQESELKRNRTLQYAFIFGLVLLSALAFLIYNRYRIKKKANKELTAAYSKLKELEQFKESMTGMIVHDLKNPLSTIISFSEQEASKNELELINSAGKQMLNMTMNILDFQKFDDSDVKRN